MKCPHCLQGFHEKWDPSSSLGADTENNYEARDCTCPECHRRIIQLGKTNRFSGNDSWSYVYPKSVSRSPIPTEVDDATLKTSYEQSCLVLADSPMASAALSRRCLQHILREKAGVTPTDLSVEIDEVVDSGKLPSDLASDLDAVRNIGNFAAHPMKGTNSGEIFDVEPGEAEWNLDVVEGLIDFYFVRPAQSRKKKEALNIKLREAGKPELPL